MIGKIFILFVLCSVCAEVSLPEDGRLNFTELATKYGQRTEEFNVITADGYILKLFHIIGDRKKPVLLVHGAIDSSDDFLLRGNISLGINLARSGFDVWAINVRGNRYSRRHLTLDPDTDTAYWDFSVTEFGNIDLPATIDFIRDRTPAKICIIGYSEGTTSTLVLGANRPEYNEKIGLFVAIAPICYLHNAKPALSMVIDLAPDINEGLRTTNSEEFVGFYSPIKKFLTNVCTMQIGYNICALLGIFPLTGFDRDQFEPGFLPVLMGHFPAGTSRKNLYHLAQIGQSHRFADYDYGARGNVARYGSPTPPLFPLNKVTMKVALFMGKNDGMATLKDVDLLRRQLPNVVAQKTMKRQSFMHFDFVLGRSAHKLVWPHILHVLERFNY